MEGFLPSPTRDGSDPRNKQVNALRKAVRGAVVEPRTLEVTIPERHLRALDKFPAESISGYVTGLVLTARALELDASVTTREKYVQLGAVATTLAELYQPLLEQAPARKINNPFALAQ